MFDELSRLQGLMALSGARGMDVRPTLLRVLTDLYIDAGHRSPSDSARFAELAGHLIDAVDEETRRVVAGKLAPCPGTPRPVLDKLLAAEPAVAAAVIAVSPLLGHDDLWSVATDGGPIRCAALARRRDLNGDLVRFLARQGEPLVIEALVQNPSAPLDREAIAALASVKMDEPGLPAILAARSDVRPAWLAPCFMALGPADRRRVAEAFVGEPNKPMGREAHVAASAARLDAIERHALDGNAAGVARELAAAFGLPDAAASIFDDPGGEPLAVALAGLGLQIDQVSRILLLVHPQARASIAVLRGLVSLAEALPRSAAARLLRAAVAVEPRPPARHQPVFSDAAPLRPGRPAGSRAQERDQSRKAGDAIP